MATAQQIIAANELAWQHWRTAARTSPVAAWLQGRGLDPAAVARAGWTPGWAADDWRDLTHLLARHGVPTQVGLDAGLLRRAESGRVYDGFRGRSCSQSAVCLTAASTASLRGASTTADEDAAQVHQLPDQRRLPKGQALFGALGGSPGSARQPRLDPDARRLRRTLRRRPDRNGRLHVLPVAPCGTAMTADQANGSLPSGGRTDLPIMLAYDGDPAGEAAMWRAWDLLRAAGARDLCLSDVPDGRDPADLCPEDLATALSLPSRRISGFTAGLGG